MGRHNSYMNVMYVTYTRNSPPKSQNEIPVLSAILYQEAEHLLTRIAAT